MAVSVRMNALLEKELELAAKRKSITKSQFILDAVRKSLGEQDPYALLLKIEAEEQASRQGKSTLEALEDERFRGDSSDSGAVRRYLLDKLRRKHGLDAH